MLEQQSCYLGDVQDQIDDILRSVREHLDMDVSFVSEFVDQQWIVRFVSTGHETPLKVGMKAPLNSTYCWHVAEGRMPQLMRNAADDPIAAKLGITQALPIGAFISVPILMENGDTFGTLCSLSSAPDYDLGRKDLDVVRICAELTTALIRKSLATTQEVRDDRFVLDSVISNGLIRTVYQPIYRLDDSRLVSFEALSRFEVANGESPAKWFRVAEEAERGLELEFLAARSALLALHQLPHKASLSINLSPEAVLDERFDALFANLANRKLVLEITEHAPIADYESVNQKLAPYRAAGLSLAIDDVGAGHSSFRHILELRPDTIKLDISLSRNVHLDHARQALTEAITLFSRKMGCEVVAEGVETIEEMETLRRAGVTKVQGYLTGRPIEIHDAILLAPYHQGHPARNAFAAMKLAC